MIDTNSSSVLEPLEHRDCRLGPQGHWARRHSKGDCQSRFASSGWRRSHAEELTWLSRKLGPTQESRPTKTEESHAAWQRNR